LYAKTQKKYAVLSESPVAVKDVVEPDETITPPSAD
jgi:hypothetical protein